MSPLAMASVESTCVTQEKRSRFIGTLVHTIWSAIEKQAVRPITVCCAASVGLWQILLQKSQIAGANFPAVRQSDLRPPIYVASITLPRSPVSLLSGDEVPHIFTRKSR